MFLKEHSVKFRRVVKYNRNRCNMTFLITSNYVDMKLTGSIQTTKIYTTVRKGDDITI